MGDGTESQLGNNPNLQEEGLGDLKLLAEFCPPDGARGPLAPTRLPFGAVVSGVGNRARK